jgi:hypothetical protein
LGIDTEPTCRLSAPVLEADVKLNPPVADSAVGLYLDRRNDSQQPALAKMQVRKTFADDVAEHAFNIAWGRLRSDIEEPLPVRSFLASHIGRQTKNGDRNRIRVANRAIRAFKARK